MWGRFVPEQMIRIEGSNRGGTVTAAMGEVRDWFGVGAGV